MQTSHDDAPPPPVPLVVDVLETDLDDTKSQTAPSKEIIQTYNTPSVTLQTSHSAVYCLSTLEDNDAPPLSDPLVVDIPDRDRDDVANITALLQVANITASVPEEPKTLENPKQDQVDIESSSRKMAYDELHEIFSWMPAKATIKYSSSLCKWLCNIHSEPRFIQKQCIRSCGQDNGLFLQYKDRKNDRVQNKFEFHLLPGETRSDFGIPRDSLDYLPKSGRILSSSNGLLLLGDHSLNGGYKFKLCNPATREWAPLHFPKGFNVIADESQSPLIECYPWGQGVLDKDEYPNDYTIALPVFFEFLWQEVNGFLEKTHKQRLVIYSHGKWDEELCDVSIEGRVVRYDMPVAVFSKAAKGLIVHYLVDSGKPGRDARTLEPYIAAYNIQEKKLSREIKLPDEAWEKKAAKVSGKNLWIFKWNETGICLVKWLFRSKGLIKAWVLDDYGCEGESWRLVMNTSEMEMWPGSGRPGDMIMSVGVASGGKGVLIATAPERGSKLFLYVVEGAEKGRLELVGDHSFRLDRAPPPGAAAFHPYAMFGLQGFPSKDPGVVTFLPYANTLRPVSVQDTKTRTY